MVGLRHWLWWIAPGIVYESNKVMGDLPVLNSVRGVAHMLSFTSWTSPSSCAKN
jgi:hypothetical protein